MGMQRIRTTRWPVRNIGGDRAYTKLLYVKGQSVAIAAGQGSFAVNQAINVGAAAPGSNLQAASLNGIMTSSPNVSTMGALYQNYRIRGIRLRLTFWQTTQTPLILFANAQPDVNGLNDVDTGPTPAFITPSITTTPEQRWAKYRVCGATAQGAVPTTLTAYYSVNKVQGPDAMIRNDQAYTGQMDVITPYFSQYSAPNARPLFGPWMQFGIATLDGTTVGVANAGTLKIEQTVYCEFFGKRNQTQ